MSQHFVRLSRQLSCEFEFHWKYTVKFRNVFVQTWKPQHTSVFDVLSPKTFFFISIKFLFLTHLVHLNKRLSCEFEHHQHCAGEMRSVLVQTWNPRKTLLVRFFGSTRNFFLYKVAFLLLPHLVRSIGRLFCEFEDHWSRTGQFRSALVETWKRPKRIFLTKGAIFIVGTPPKSNRPLSCKFALNHSIREKLRQVSLDYCIVLKPPKKIFFDNFSAQKVFTEVAVFIVLTPSAINSAATLWAWAQSKQHNEIFESGKFFEKIRS